MDVFGLLVKEHQDVKALMERILIHCERASLLELHQWLQQLCSKLLAHMDLEESLLYAVIQKQTDLKDIIALSYQEHNDVKQIIRSLERCSTSPRLIRQKIEQLRNLVKHHIREEEIKVFPKAREQLSTFTIRKLSQQMMQAKRSEQASFQYA